MKTYQVHAKRWERGWELHIDGVGVTQTRSLAKAEENVTDYLDMLVGQEDREILLVPELGAALEKSIRAARDASARASEMQREAAERSREIVRSLMDRGLPGAEVAAVLKVSPQRVSQLVAEIRSSMGGARKAAPAAAKSASKGVIAKRPAPVPASRSKNPAKTSAVRRKAPAKSMAAKKSSKSTPEAGRRSRS